MLAKIKFWAIIAGGIVMVIMAVLLRTFGAGKLAERAENTVAAGKAKEKFDARVNQAHQAGDRVRSDVDGGVLDVRADDGHKRKPKAK